MVITRRSHKGWAEVCGESIRTSLVKSSVKNFNVNVNLKVRTIFIKHKIILFPFISIVYKFNTDFQVIILLTLTIIFDYYLNSHKYILAKVKDILHTCFVSAFDVGLPSLIC